MTIQAYQYAGGYGTVAIPNAPILSPRSPLTTDIVSPNGNPYQLGQFWKNTLTATLYEYAGGGIWVEISGATGGPIDTLTGNTGGAIGPTAGNINILGANTTTVSGSGSTLTINASASGYPITPYVVGPVGQAGYQTIQSAVTAIGAGSGLIFVQSGTYTENITFVAGSNITIQGSGYVHTTITGVHVPPATGSLNIENIKLTSATHIFSSAAAGTARISLFNTDVRVTNGYCFNLLNWTGELDVFTSTSVLGTNDGFLNNTGGATSFVINSDVGIGAGNSAVMTGVNIQFVGASLNCPATIGGAGSILFAEGCEVFRTLTTAGTATLVATDTVFEPISGAAISHGSAGTMGISTCSMKSSNNPVISGAGAGVITLTGVDFTDGFNLAGTLTFAAGETRGGNYVSQYVVGPAPDAKYQTIQSAVTAIGASDALIYVKPGTYTENITFTAASNVTIKGCGYGNTIITGVHVPPATGTVEFQDVRLTSATHIFNSAVAGSARLSLFNTDVRVTNGYCFNLLNWTGELDVFTSSSVLGTNDGFLNNTGAATVFVINADVGFGTGNAAVMTGTNVQFVSASLNCPATIGGSGSALFVEGCEIYHTFTTAGTAITAIYGSLISTGATAAISHGSAGTTIVSNSTITSSNNPAIAGAGAGVLTLGGVDFTSNTAIAGTLTLASTDRFRAGSVGVNTVTITSGSGAPSASLPKGSLYLRTDGSGVNDRAYIATDAAGTWTALVTVA